MSKGSFPQQMARNALCMLDLDEQEKLNDLRLIYLLPRRGPGGDRTAVTYISFCKTKTLHVEANKAVSHI